MRAMFVLEEGGRLWLAKGTPRAWLEQGKKIAVTNAPSAFGDVAYEIVSDVDHGTIEASLTIPSSKSPQDVVLRLRHPKGFPIQSVRVNGEPWKGFDAAGEYVDLKDVAGIAKVVVKY